MGKLGTKTCRLLTMLGLTASFFLVEIIVGYITNSIALIADSFHMLSDVVALIVGFASVRVSGSFNMALACRYKKLPLHSFFVYP